MLRSSTRPGGRHRSAPRGPKGFGPGGLFRKTERMVRVAISARPGSDRDEIRWDPWRKCWSISCRAPAVAGSANAALLRLLSGWLEVPSSTVRWVVATRSRSKLVEVDRLSEEEVSARLARASERSTSRG